MTISKTAIKVFAMACSCAVVTVFRIPATAQTSSTVVEENKSERGTAEWKYSKEENPLYGKSFDRFTLTGKYLKPPSAIGHDPELIIGCMNGKFASGEFSLGAVARFTGTHSFKGKRQAQLDMRIDEKKKTEEWLEVSNDRKTLSFDAIQFTKYLTGRLLGHPSENNTLTHRLIFGVVEEGENEVIVQFDMPKDVAQMVDVCSLEWGRKKRKR